MSALTPTIEWRDDHLAIIDQTLLPTELAVIDVTDVDGAVDAIVRLAVRGAPALGVFGAYALVVAVDEARAAHGDDVAALHTRLAAAATRLAGARPTAVNLRWAVERAHTSASDPPAATADELRSRLLTAARSIHAEDAAACESIGRLADELLGDSQSIATHCNAGRLATAGIGTALAPLYVRARRGAPDRVYASETRPLLQGARLTAWELAEAGIDVTVVPDGAMAMLMARGDIDACIVGADRIAANGDVANKVGTLSHALAAARAGVPFYVAAPISTVDLDTAVGTAIVIEQRSGDEVHHAGGSRVTPTTASAANPAFDVTPAELVTAIITERGVCQPPFGPSLAAVVASSGPSGSDPSAC